VLLARLATGQSGRYGRLLTGTLEEQKKITIIIKREKTAKYYELTCRQTVTITSQNRTLFYSTLVDRNEVKTLK